MKHEEKLQMAVCNYLKLQYPDVIFFSEPSGLYLKSWNQRKMLKAMRSAGKLPDLFIAKPMKPFAGLFLELKADGNSPYMKDGKTLMAGDHVKAQAVTLERLRAAGYAAFFSVGFDETKINIDTYLKPI